MVCSSGTLLTFLVRAPKSGRMERQNHGQAGSSAVGVGSADPPVVGDDDLLDKSQPETGPARLRGEDRPKNTSPDGRTAPWAVAAPADPKHPGPVGAALDGNPGGTSVQASRAFRQRLLNAWRSSTSSPSTTPNCP